MIQRYTLKTDPLTIVVQYLDDVKLGVPSNKTPAAVIQEIEKRVQRETSAQVYRDLICTSEGVSTIHNKRQVQYRRQKQLNQLKLTHDEITLCAPPLALSSKIDHSKKLSIFSDKCQKNATYDSTTTVTKLSQSTSEPIELYISLLKIKDKETIFDTLVKELQ
ncbi:unnamed protein product [Didymodactylos carnosus]|uniref:Uncharacterized protein n=1 Tax=Didymodactylos carnosus TaxID=1234261 RepID=A0A814T2B4_9BILA|nr:unnamed protein product [Didymodactylos carnosus]CAF3917658.1 unnamed protein product [Didymodactylos carnosus]